MALARRFKMSSRIARRFKLSARSKPIVLLDIDGVLRMPVWSRERFDGEDILTPCPSGMDSDIRSFVIRPAVIARITDWATNGLAEPRWLTSWGAAAKRTFATATRMADIPFADETDGPVPLWTLEPDDWWSKMDFGRAVLQDDPNRAVVWIDDDNGCAFREALTRTSACMRETSLALRLNLPSLSTLACCQRNYPPAPTPRYACPAPSLTPWEDSRPRSRPPSLH